MAAAYAALLSLFNNLEDIQNHPRQSFPFDNNQIQPLFKIVTFLINFMESPDNSQLLERRITLAAHAVEEVIESHVVDQIRAGKSTSRFPPDLQKVIEGMDFVMREAMEVIKAQSEFKLKQQPTLYSSIPLTSEKKISMVGFDDVRLQLLDLLTGEPSRRRVIPIVGMGGIGKTTLAKIAFEHSIIVQHFDVCVWATICQQFVVEDILLKRISRRGRSYSEKVLAS